MNIDRAVLAFAGLVVLAGLVLAQIYSPWWLPLTAFAGRKHAPSGLHRLLPGSHHLQDA